MCASVMAAPPLSWQSLTRLTHLSVIKVELIAKNNTKIQVFFFFFFLKMMLPQNIHNQADGLLSCGVTPAVVLSALVSSCLYFLLLSLLTASSRLSPVGEVGGDVRNPTAWTAGAL